MRGKGWIASTLFGALCLGGIATLMSQANFPASAYQSAAGEHRVTLDPAGAPSKDFEGILPMSLRKGAEVQAPPEAKPGKDSGRILKLR